jgi:hypothetical protein
MVRNLVFARTWGTRRGVIRGALFACGVAFGAAGPLLGQTPESIVLDATCGIRRATLHSLTVARCDHAIVPLDATHVLVTGGAPFEIMGASALASCEIIDTASGTCRPAASMHVARRGHGIARLPDGAVVVVGGVDGHGTLSSAELYEPANDTWRTLASMREARAYFGLCMLPDGRIVVAGGAGNNGDLGVSGDARALAGVEMLEVVRSSIATQNITSTWSDLPPLSIARAQPAMLRWHDGSLFVLGGVTRAATESHSIFNALNRGGNRVDHPTRAVERFDWAGKTWSSCPELPSAHDAPITASALDAESILVVACPWQALGEGEHALEIYDVQHARWSEATPMSMHAQLPWPAPTHAPGATEATGVSEPLGHLVESAGSLLFFNPHKPLATAFWCWDGDPREQLTDAGRYSYGTGAAALRLDATRLLRVGGTWSGQASAGVFEFELSR